MAALAASGHCTWKSTEEAHEARPQPSTGNSAQTDVAHAETRPEADSHTATAATAPLTYETACAEMVGGSSRLAW